MLIPQFIYKIIGAFPTRSDRAAICRLIMSQPLPGDGYLLYHIALPATRSQTARGGNYIRCQYAGATTPPPLTPNSLSRSGLHPPPNVCNLCFKMLPSLAALESHLQSEHAKETAPGHGHGHAPASTVAAAAAAAAAAALRPHASEAGSPYGAKVSVFVFLVYLSLKFVLKSVVLLLII